MTKTEAIDLLDNLIGFVEDSHDNDYDEALKMAIEALKETDMGLNNGDHLHPFGEPFGWTEEEIQKHGLRELLKAVDNKKDDLIRRQDAIGLIRGMYPSSPILPSNRRKWAEKYEQFISVEREISKLPSAQPSEEYEKGWKDGQEALREEIWEYDRD